MRVLVTLLAASMTLGAPTAFAQDVNDPAALAPAIEQCIRANASRVEAAVPDLANAVDYLVSDVCVVPVAAERNRQMRSLMHAQQVAVQQQCAEQRTSGKPDVTDEDGENACSPSFMPDDAGGWTMFAPVTVDSAPPAAKALAAQLLLDLRLSHSKAGSTH